MYQSINIGALMTQAMQQFWDRDDSPFHGQTVPTMNVFMKPADVLFPLKAGDIVFSDGPDADFRKVEFRFGVALNEPGIIEAQSLVQLLTQFVGLADGIITDLPELN